MKLVLVSLALISSQLFANNPAQQFETGNQYPTEQYEQGEATLPVEATPPPADEEGEAIPAPGEEVVAPACDMGCMDDM